MYVSSSSFNVTLYVTRLDSPLRAVDGFVGSVAQISQTRLGYAFGLLGLLYLTRFFHIIVYTLNYSFVIPVTRIKRFCIYFFIFISHRRTDKVLAGLLCSLIESYRPKLWVSELGSFCMMLHRDI